MDMCAFGTHFLFLLPPPSLAAMKSITLCALLALATAAWAVSPPGELGLPSEDPTFIFITTYSDFKNRKYIFGLA